MEGLSGWLVGWLIDREPLVQGGGLAGSQLHVARAVCRRAERSVVALVGLGQVDGAVGRYLNRLSDFLFVAARYAAMRGGHAEVTYKKPVVRSGEARAAST